MPATAPTNDKLDAVAAAMLQAAAAALQRHIGQEVALAPQPARVADPAALLAGSGLDHAVARGALESHVPGSWLRVVLPAPDASSLSGHLMMSPPALIEARRRGGALDGEELEAFAEVANVLFSSFDASLRQNGAADRVALRAHDHGVVARGGDPSALLGADPLIALPFTLALAAGPASRGWLLLEPATAEHWNGQALAAEPAADGEPPAAPIQGRLTAYLAEPDVVTELRQSCRRVGLELDRRARAEVPNPAEHKDGIVLLDVPNGDTRRFEWCKRLKHYHEGVRVALLIHHPSRSRVLQGFLAKADAIMGWPIGERELSEKLATLMATDDGEAR